MSTERIGVIKLNSMQSLIEKAKNGFAGLEVNTAYRKHAIQFLEDWLTKNEFRDYIPQIEHIIRNRYWDYLLDSFYQIIPFGTGGRRGEVGVGPNRINPWTVKASAQGHAQYLLKKYGDGARRRGVVFAYDVRVFFGNRYLSDEVHNLVKEITSKDLTIAAAEVYAANGIRVHLFSDVRTTPELSFAIRYLHAVAGAMFSASHNPPHHNGKKVYDEFGGQLIPPHDEALVLEVTNNVSAIQEMPYDDAVQKGLITEIGSVVDEAYLEAATKVSLSRGRDIRVVYTPLHGCGMTSVYRALHRLGFAVREDPATSNPSGKFEHITFNIPNPEVVQSFDTTVRFATEEDADIVLSSDPDADRIGVMARHRGNWVFMNGNEIAALLTHYVIQKKKQEFTGNETIVKTMVTTNLITKMCKENGVALIGDLLIGFKYIAHAMNTMEKNGTIAGFLLGAEESHGYLAGSYSRDKDAVPAAIWLSELAAELKKESKTLVDCLTQIYAEYGYYHNYLTEIRLLGASGKEKIDRIQSSLRENRPAHFGPYRVIQFEDCRERAPIVSETDKSAKDVLIFHIEGAGEAKTIKVTIRPSGTEPKIKMYFEIGTSPVVPDALEETKKTVATIVSALEKAVMLACYTIIGVDFPERGFLLFSQLPLDDKLKYFEIEPKIEGLKSIEGKEARREAFRELVSFLGSDPVEKIDEAFRAKHGVSVLAYLNLLQ